MNEIIIGSGAAHAVVARPILDLLAADHVMLDALLRGALAPSGAVDPRSFQDFREALLRHIAIEENVLLPAARAARGGDPLPGARRLRVEHGAIAALLVPFPTADTILELRKILGPHNVVEDCHGGVYEACDALLASRADEIVRRIREYPHVAPPPHQGGVRACRTAREALLEAARQADGLG